MRSISLQLRDPKLKRHSLNFFLFNRQPEFNIIFTAPFCLKMSLFIGMHNAVYTKTLYSIMETVLIGLSLITLNFGYYIILGNVYSPTTLYTNDLLV